MLYFQLQVKHIPNKERKSRDIFIDRGKYLCLIKLLCTYVLLENNIVKRTSHRFNGGDVRFSLQQITYLFVMMLLGN